MSPNALFLVMFVRSEVLAPVAVCSLVCCHRSFGRNVRFRLHGTRFGSASKNDTDVRKGLGFVAGSAMNLYSIYLD